MSEAALAEGGESAPPPADYRTIYRAMKTPQLISEAWLTQEDPELRDEIVGLLATRQRPEAEGAAAWPSVEEAKRDEMSGLYPDPEDPEFAARLFAKREFYESRAIAAAVAEGTIDPCSSAAAANMFELTPVQRIVSRFLHPLTPYMGVLIDHGVGVGKTCTAVTIAEQFLEQSPGRQVIVVAPQALQENFRKTVFDPAKLRWDAVTGRWTVSQCTGTSYLERLDLMTNPDMRVVTYKVEEDRRARYHITGYLELANWIDRTLSRSLPASLSGPDREIAENELLRRLFSDHLIIIDEAHNLRDSAAGPSKAAEQNEEDTTKDTKENDAGKALNPWLRRVCMNAEGMRLVLMTATPMYNAAPEICLLLNYLIMNDEKSERNTLKPASFFTKEGDLKPGAATRALERLARRYVTYMRGENPFTFPLRMSPLDATSDAVAEWPAISASKRPVVLTPQEEAVIRAMPFVFTEPDAGSPPEENLRAATSRAAAEGEEASVGGDAMLDQRMQMGDLTYPDLTYGSTGWNAHFLQDELRQDVAPGRVKKTRFYRPKGGFDVDSVFSGEGLRRCAPKMHRIVESVTAAKGICFVYTQYIRAGAMPMAVALERAGFQRRMADGRIFPLLQGIDAPPPICAICGQQETAVAHAGADHPFRPACYVLLTSDEEISPSFGGLVRQAASWPKDPEWGPLGTNVKVVIGSRVASEGLDLKCIREMHIMDAWYHLNRVEQIIGRAIRYCSHSALRAIESRQGLPPMSLNNCLIYLHALRVPARDEGKLAFESADMYAYRVAIAKALMVGRVQRILKTNAWDCNLELEAIIFAGLPPRRQIDAQGNDRRSRDETGATMEGYSINDQDYTTYCDYQACKHQCAVSIPQPLHLDSSTFTVSDARRLVLAKQQYVRRLFEDQVVIPETMLQEIFRDLPWEIASEALMELLDGRRFRLRRPDGVEGFLVKKAGYVVFQPAAIHDTEIPMTMRYARAFQLQRHFMEPQLSVLARAEEAAPPPPTVAAVAAPASSAVGSVATATSPILAKWTEWLTFVRNKGAAPLPPSMPEAANLFKFLLSRYADFPGHEYVALRYWFDRQSVADQRVLLETALSVADAADPLMRVTEIDIYLSKQTKAYRVFNPESGETEYYCRSLAEGANPNYTACTPQLTSIIEARLNTPAVKRPDNVGELFGFLVPKKGIPVFKTLERSKDKGKAVAGAECGNVTNLTDHVPRIRLLQAAASDADAGLKALMIPEQGVRSDERKYTPASINDLTQPALCLYMEWLTRILDAQRVGGRRWFLTAAVALAVGLKGRA
jgi:hypothetical protein